MKGRFFHANTSDLFEFYGQQENVRFFFCLVYIQFTYSSPSYYIDNSRVVIGNFRVVQLQNPFKISFTTCSRSVMDYFVTTSDTEQPMRATETQCTHDVKITSLRHCFDFVMTLLLRHVPIEKWPCIMMLPAAIRLQPGRHWSAISEKCFPEITINLEN